MRRTGLVVAIGALVVVAGAAFLLRDWDFWSADRELPAAIQEYRSAGLPWTAADLNERPVPKAENAAELVRKAMAKWDDPSVDRFALAHQIALKPRLDFERDWDLGPNLTYPEGSMLPRFCKLLTARAEQRAQEGDDTGALADLGDARSIAALFGQEPSAFAAEKCIGGYQKLLESTRRCLNTVGRDPRRSARYRQWLREEWPLPDMARAIRGRIYETIVFARSLDLMGIGRELAPSSDDRPFFIVEDAGPPPVFRRSGLPENVRSRAYLTRCLQLWTELAKKTHGLTDDADTIERRYREIADRVNDEPALSYRLTSLLFVVPTRDLQTGPEFIEARNQLAGAK